MANLTSRPSRRMFLLGGVAIGAIAAVGWSVYPQRLKAATGYDFETPLAIPMLDTGTMTDGIRVFDMAIADGQTEFFSGLQTPTRGVNGGYLGPTLRLRQGEVVRFNVANNLTEATTLHWHGVNLPATADGGPHQPIAPGAVWSPEFEIKDRAATMWYHSHLMGSTARQVWQGLAGMLVIDDAASDALDIPKTYGVDDIPIVLQDRRFNRDGSMPYAPSMHDGMAGMIGNIPMVNGTILPYFDATTTQVRLRLLNGSNASIYGLEFNDGRAFHQIASDGGLLEAPVKLMHIKLAPGERAEIVVDLSDGKAVQLLSVARGTAPSGMGMGGMMQNVQSAEFTFMEIRPSATAVQYAALPAKLTALAQVSSKDAVRTRNFLLEMGGMGMGSMMGGGGGFTINGAEMDMGVINETVKMGETEIWQINNAGPMAHPFHVHNTQFRILSRDGNAPEPHEAGRKDTVLVNPGETVQILVKFEHYADPERPYMYHCHILEHEDSGMMGQFTVV